MDDPTSISKFSKEFVVAERCVKDYLEYLTLLDLKKDKRKKERHIIQQQIQGFTQEEGSPLCTSENEDVCAPENCPLQGRAESWTYWATI